MVLKTDPREYIYVSQFEMFREKFITKEKGNLLILLDQIIDPQNLGSIVRSSFFLGVDKILLNKKNKPSLTSAVSKVSSGASECVDLYAVKNVKNFITSNKPLI
jgi:21S rRNA (GM2251-2'-O)-methyltransferase